jgi:hypothetical protein
MASDRVETLLVAAMPLPTRPNTPPALLPSLTTTFFFNVQNNPQAKAKQDSAVKLRMHLPAKGSASTGSDDLCCELNSKSTVVRIRLFASHSASDSQSEHLLKGGDFVRLFHQEDGALLEIARWDKRGVKAEKAADFICAENTLCLRELPTGVEPDSANPIARSTKALWQIELKDTRAGGRAVQWGEPLRLKNIFSDGYIDIAKRVFEEGVDMAYGVQTETPGASCFVTFEPMDGLDIEDGVPITTSDAVYIKAVEGSKWLHGEHRVDDMSGADSSSKSESDVYHSHFINPSFVEQMKDEDAFIMYAVDLKDIQELTRAKECHATCVEMSLMTVAEAEGLADGSQDFRKYKNALDQMIKFCTKDDNAKDADVYDGEPQTYRQNLLTDLRVEDAVMVFASKLFKEHDAGDEENANTKWRNESRPGYLTNFKTFGGYNLLVRKCYRLLRQLSKGNAHNGFQIGQKFRVHITNACRLISHVSLPDEMAWNIPSALEEMFRDNIHLLKECRSYIKTFVNLIKEAPSVRLLHRYFQLLGTFCTFNGEPMEDLQDAVFAEIQDIITQKPTLVPSGKGASKSRKKKSKAKSVSKAPRRASSRMGGAKYEETDLDAAAEELDDAYEGGDMEVVVSLRVFDKAKTNNPFEKWEKKDIRLSQIANPEFYATVLYAVAEMSTGRHQKSRDFVAKNICPFDVCMAVLRDEDVDARIRKGFATLLRRVYINAGLIEKQTIVLSRRWDDITAEKPITAQKLIIEGLINDQYGNQTRGNQTRGGTTASTRKIPWYVEVMKWVHHYFSGSTVNNILSLEKERRFKLAKEETKKDAENDMDNETNLNEFTKEILGMVTYMIKFGFFRVDPNPKGKKEFWNGKRNCAVLSHNLIKLLGTPLYPSDTSDANGENAATTDSHTHRVVTSTKTAIIEALRVMLELHANDMVSSMLEVFKDEMEPLMKKNAHLGLPQDSKLKALPCFTNKDQFLWFRQLGGTSNSMISEEEFVYLMLKHCEYEDDTLRLKAMELLLDTFNLKGKVLHLLDDCFITVDEEELKLLKGLDVRRKQIKESQRHQIETWKDVKAEQGGTTNLLTAMLRDMQWMINKLELPPNKNAHAIIVFRQGVMRNNGLMETVVKLLERQLPAAEQEEDEVLKLLKAQPVIGRYYRRCFSYLRMCVRDNEANQAVMFKYIPFLVRMCQYGIGAAASLSNIMAHKDAKRQLTHGITNELIENIFKEPKCRTAVYLKLVSALVKPGGRSDKHQQMLVANALFKDRTNGEFDRFHKLYGLEGGRPEPLVEGELRVKEGDDLYLARLSAVGEKVGILRKKLEKHIKKLHQLKGELLDDIVHKENEATYKNAVYGYSMVDFFRKHKLVRTEPEGMNILKELLEAHVITAVTAKPVDFTLPKDKPESASHRVFRFLAEGADAQLTHDAYRHDTPGGATEFAIELGVVLGHLADQNPHTRSQICEDLTFTAVTRPLTNPSTFGTFRLRTKRSVLELAQVLYFYETDADDAGLDENLEGTAQKGVTAYTPLEYIKICNTIAQEVKAIAVPFEKLCGSAFNPLDNGFDVGLQDDFMLDTLMPFALGLIDHSARALSLADAEMDPKVTGAVDDVIVQCIAYFGKRQQCDEFYAVSPKSRVVGARRLGEFLLFDQQLELLYKGGRTATLMAHKDLAGNARDWWRGEQETANAARGNTTKKGTTGFGTAKGTSKGTSKGTKKSKANRANPRPMKKYSSMGAGDDANLHEKSKTEYVDEELHRFRDHALYHMQVDHTKRDHSWMIGNTTEEIDFKEFWRLVQIIRTQLIILSDKDKVKHDKGGVNAIEATATATASKFEIEPSFQSIFKHFSNDQSDSSMNNAMEVDDTVYEIMSRWLSLLCGLVMVDPNADAGGRSQRGKNRVMVMLGIPKLILFLAAADHADTAKTAAQLAIELLKESEFETAIAEGPKMIDPDKMEWAHTQRRFYDVLNGPGGYARRLFSSLKDRVEQQKEVLLRNSVDGTFCSL